MAEIEVKVLRVDGTELDIINAARESYGIRKEEFDDVKDTRLIQFMLHEGHTSPFEQVGILWHLKMPLFIAEQFKKQRMFSINELSRRFTDKHIEMFEFDSYRIDDQVNKQGSAEAVWDAGDLATIERMFREADDHRYRTLRELGVTKEQARGVLPTQTMTSMTVHTDLHNLLHYLGARTANDAQKEHQEMAARMATLAAEVFPNTLRFAEELWRLNACIKKALKRVRAGVLTIDAMIENISLF